MTVRGLRDKFLQFYASKGHVQVPSGSLVPYDVTGRLDESLLFNGAGMIQFKPYFRGVAVPESKRAMTAQKCVRTGDIEIVGDATHLTFFEMLGNFSFGDYFKSEAIDFSWEFLTSPEWLGLDPKRLAFSIYQDDDDAFEKWATHLRSVGIDPELRIFRLDEDSNYWPAGALSKGPPGPCGPNSEMFYWTKGDPPTSAPYGVEDFLKDDEKGNWVEIWNDVFIQYDWQGHLKNPARPSDGYIKDGMPNLPSLSIDTGMGLERTAMVLGGYSTVYESDVFEPILSTIRALAPGETTPERTQAERVIADHIRTASFCIADGIFPSNNGRGYVLRRLIRRAVLKGQRVLGLNQPFFANVFEGVRQAMGDFYLELEERKATILETLANEEAQFRRTLSSGATLLDEELSELPEGGTLPGAIAFRLYDTFGFPLEVTQEIALEGGYSVDADGYETAMEEAQVRSRAGQSRESVYGGVQGSNEVATPDAPSTTNFVGYTETSAVSQIVRVRPTGENRWQVALIDTPFYAESGGQAGDFGTLHLRAATLEVTATTKASGTFWHEVQFGGTAEQLLGSSVEAKVDESRRNRIRRNHTATHLLHAALRGALGAHVAQAGSFVGPDSLRFDFSHGSAIAPEDLAAIEAAVNERALANTPVETYVDLPIDEARAKGAMALFGEKYGNLVRMVEVGDYSRELCGGTHVRSTGEIGLFKILSESSAASGIRRIEAITGEAAYGWVIEEWSKVREASNLLRSTPNQLVPSVERVLDQLKDEKKKREKAETAAARGSGNGAANEGSKPVDVKGVTLWVSNFGEVNPKIVASELDNAAAGNPKFVGIVAAVNEGKVSLFAKAGADAVAQGAHAGNLIRNVASLVGGSGGGRAEFATAGGKDPSKLDEALATVRPALEAMLK